MSNEPPGWDELFGDAFPEDDDERDEDAAPTPGERILYALGQLDRLHRRHRLPFDARAFDIEDLARVLGIVSELEFITEDRDEMSCHFPGAPLAPALQAMVADARAEQARLLRDDAARAAPKIQLVVALVLVPAVMLLVAAVLVQALG